MIALSVIEKDNKFFMSDFASIVYGMQTADSINYHEHKHDFVEMVYMLKGRCTHIVDGKSYPVRHGDLVIVNYNQTHKIEGDSEATYINILMKPEYINQSLAKEENAFALLHLAEFEEFSKILDESKCKVTFTGDERDRIEAIIDIIQKEISKAQPGYELAVKSQFNLLMIMIFRKMSLDLSESFTGVSDELLSYIASHCNEKLTLEDIAKRCSYNSSYFSRKFKEYTGVNFTSYLKTVRISKAVKLLESTSMKISDIYPEAGYTDKTKFFAHFKSIMGVSPLKYRKGKK